MPKTCSETKHPIPVFDSTSGVVLGVLMNKDGEPLMLSEADLAEVVHSSNSSDDPNEPPF